jgi:putative phosphoesterase
VLVRIGLVSDTHGLFDPELPRLLEGCDRIVHAGDVVGDAVLDALARIAPVDAVRGNNDPGSPLPLHRVLDLGTVRALLIHEIGRPSKLEPEARQLVDEHQPSLVIFGHSHQPVVERQGDLFFVNPGSAGPRRFRLPRCAGVLEVGPAGVHVRIADLDAGLESLIETRLFS